MKYSSTEIELTNLLPITNNSSVKKVIFSLPVQIKAGELITGLGHFEVTNQYKFNVGVGLYVSLENSQNGLNGQRLQKATMKNVTPEVHHDVFTIQFMQKFTKDFIGFVNVIAYAAASSGTGNAIVERGYGQLGLKIE